MPLARHIFAAPTRFYKTGLAFLAWLNGHQAHFVMVEPHDASSEFKAGDTVLLVRREGQTFYGVQYESPLLGLGS